MNLSNYLAELWGISLAAIPLALLLNPKYLKRIFSELENEGTMFFCGATCFIAGLASVLAHNIWIKNWQVSVTILSWLLLLKGLGLLFLPEQIKLWTKKTENSQWLPIALVAVVFIGLAITYFGFTA